MIGRGLIIVGALLAVGACDDDDPVGPDTGTLEVTVSTTGEDLDPDGYVVDLNDGAETENVDINGSVTLEEVDVGDHTVELTGVASNCTVAEDNPRTATVETGETETVSFTVTCTASGS